MSFLDIFTFLTPDFSEILQLAFFLLMMGMLLLTVISVHVTASSGTWEKKWERASASKAGTAQGIEQGGITDLYHIVASRPEKLAEVMPGMLLIVGLLGTFIGLGLALDKASSILGASSAADAAGAADGLQNMLGMLKGLGTKFKTSTWGIAGFILLKVWSEVNQHEEKRLAWVIGKVKNEAEARNEQHAIAEQIKWEKSVQLGTTLAADLAAAFENNIQKSLDAAMQNNRLLIEKNGEFFSAQTDSLILNQKSTADAINININHLFESQNAALAEQHAISIQEKGRLNEKIVAQLHGIAEASVQTQAAIQSFTNDTQQVISNMDSSVQRMAKGADDVGAAAQDLLGAVGKFESQFTEVLDRVRSDLGNAISEMSEKASQTLEVGSQKLSDSTIQISQSLAQLSKDVTGTMTEVRTSIQKALEIQSNASQEIIKSSDAFREGITEITDNVGRLASPIEDGLAAVSKSSQQMKSAIAQMVANVDAAKDINTNISLLIEKFAHFDSIPDINKEMAVGLMPLKDIHALLNEIRINLPSKGRSNKTETHQSLGVDSEHTKINSLTSLGQLRTGATSQTSTQ